MFRSHSGLLILILTCLTLACKTYTAGLQQSTARADETVALTALHSISLAQQTYSVSNNGRFGTFPQLVKSGSLDERFNADSPKLKGYVLTLTVVPKSAESPADAYGVNADPVGAGPQAARHLYLDSVSGLIHVNETKPATVDDPVVATSQ